MKNLILKKGLKLKLVESSAWTDAVGLKIGSIYSVEHDSMGRLIVAGSLGQLILVNETNELTDAIDAFIVLKQDVSF